MESLLELLDDRLFLHTPTKRVLFFGEKCYPATTVQARNVLLASVMTGLAIEDKGQARDLTHLLIPPERDVDDYCETVSSMIARELEMEPAVEKKLQLWLFAGIEDCSKFSSAWQPIRTIGTSRVNSARLGLVAGLTGRAPQLSAWLYGINDEWERTHSEGLAIDQYPPFETDGDWRSACCDMLDDLWLGDVPHDLERDEDRPWRGLVQLWRFEVFRMRLFGIARHRWRQHKPFSWADESA